MAADQERADRIRALKRENPQLRWRHIADHVGVELRSAQMWQETGAISYENAKKLAELVGSDVDWIMRGPRDDQRAPSPFAGQDALADQLDRIENLLQRQNEVLKRIEDSIAAEKVAKTEAEDARRRLLEAAQAASRIYEDAAQRLEEAHGTQAT